MQVPELQGLVQGYYQKKRQVQVPLELVLEYSQN